MQHVYQLMHTKSQTINLDFLSHSSSMNDFEVKNNENGHILWNHILWNTF